MKRNMFFVAMIFAIATGCSPKITSNTNSRKDATKEEEASGGIKLTQGQKYLVETKLTTSSNTQMQGQSMESNADISSTYNIEVNELTAGNYNMTNSMSSIKMNMSAMGQNMNFDSDKKEDLDGEMGSTIKNFINKPNPVVMDKAGNIIISKETDSVKEETANNQTAMILKQMGDPAEQGYGAKMAFIAIPKNAKAGTSWTDSTSNDGITRITNYTVKEINGDTATLSISGTEKRETKMEMQGMEINTNTNGKFTGEEIVNITSGVISQNNTTAEASGTIKVMGQEIPTSIKATSVTTVKPL
jgi:hypothetical protein